MSANPHYADLLTHYVPCKATVIFTPALFYRIFPHFWRHFELIKHLRYIIELQRYCAVSTMHHTAQNMYKSCTMYIHILALY